MYYVIQWYEDVKVIDCPSKEIAQAYCKKNTFELCYEINGIVTPDDESNGIEILSESDISELKRLIDVEKNNKVIYERLKQLDEELPKTITMVPPVTYIGFRADESTFSEAKKRIDKFLEEWNMLINSGYKQIGTTVAGYTLCPPNYDEVLMSQKKERERLKADLWE